MQISFPTPKNVMYVIHNRVCAIRTLPDLIGRSRFRLIERSDMAKSKDFLNYVCVAHSHLECHAKFSHFCFFFYIFP